MPKISSVQRIRAEDYKADDREMVSKLAPILNQFMEEVVNVFDGNVDYDNLRQQLSVVELELDSTGVPKKSTKIKLAINGRVIGTRCIRVDNLSNALFPTSSPFITYVTENQLLTVKHITGLRADTKYRLVIEIVGE